MLPTFTNWEFTYWGLISRTAVKLNGKNVHVPAKRMFFLELAEHSTLTDLEDSSEPEDSVSLLLRLLELRYGEDDGESSM